MSNRTAEVQRGKNLGWRVPDPKEMAQTVVFPSVPYEQSPLPIFDSTFALPPVTEGVGEHTTEQVASLGSIHEDQLALFAQALPSLEDRQAMYQARLTLLYEEKKRGNLGDVQFAARLEHLNIGWGKPKDWDIVDEIGQGEKSLAHAKQASEEYLAGRGKQADQSYDQTVATPFGNLRAHKQEFSLPAYQDMDETRDAIEESVDALKATRYQSLRLSRKMYETKMPIGGKIQELKEQINDWEQAAPTPTRKAIAFMGRVGVTGLEMAALAGCALQGIEPTLTHAPSATHTPSPTSTATHEPGFETGQMFAQTPEGRAFYDALQVHQVAITDCTPTKIGALVEKNQLSLDKVAKLTTLTTEALKKTPEPDHLASMVCDANGENGSATIRWFLRSDADGNKDGKVNDIFIPDQSGQSGVLLPGIINGSGEAIVIAPPLDKPTGAVSPPDWKPLGGPVSDEIQTLMKVGEESIRESLKAKGITENIRIQHVFRGSGNDFRIGSGVITSDGTAMFFPKFDDEVDGYAWRPDLQLVGRQWHWEKITLPKGVTAKIGVFIDEDSDVPQFVVLTSDGSRMIGWFDNTTGEWRTPDGRLLTKDTVPTNTPTPSNTPTSTKTLTPTPTFTSTMTPTPSKTPTVTMTPRPTRVPFVVRPDLEAVVPDTWEKCASKESDSAKYWMARALNEYEKDLVEKKTSTQQVIDNFKASGSYAKPSFVVQGSQRASDGAFRLGFIASTFDAIAIGSQQCILNTRFGGKTGLNINVNVGYFIPIDSPEKVIAVVMNVTYPDNGVNGGTTVLGARGIHTSSGDVQQGFTLQNKAMYRLRAMASSDHVSIAQGAIPNALNLLDSWDMERLKQIGLSMDEVLGISSKEKASSVLYSNNGKADAGALFKFVMDKPMMMVAEIIAKN